MIKAKIIILIFFLLNFIPNKSLTLEVDQFEIESKEIVTKNNNTIIEASGDAVAKDNFGRKISADKIIYYRNKSIVEAYGKARFFNDDITLEAKKLIYSVEQKKIEAEKNVKLIDKDKNQFFLDNLVYLENNKKFTGKNLVSKLNDGSYLQSKKGYLDKKNNTSTLENVNYTTCSIIKNKKDEFCPSWSLNSKKTIHDKKKKILKHYNAILKIKKIPILYTPYISHPDPSVKRKSGFLPPVIKSTSNIGRTLKIPFFWAISEDRDITISPILHKDQHQMINTSYRQATNDGFLNIETSYTKGYKKFTNLNRTKGSRNYFFFDFENNKKNILDKSKINFKIQRISQKNYLKSNKLNTKLFKEDIFNLENTIKLSKYNQKKRFEIKTGVLENLNSNDNQKYSYLLPDGVISQRFNKIKNINSNFSSYFQGKKFLNNQKQGKITNIISANTDKIINKKFGLATNFGMSLLNTNLYNENVATEKNYENIDAFATFAVNNSIPFTRISKYSYHILTPKLLIKKTTGKTKSQDYNKILNYSDVFSINRSNKLDSPETGTSLGYGIDYNYNKYVNENLNQYKNFKIGFGQVLKNKKNENMPKQSSLDKKNSDIVGFVNFNNFGIENNYQKKQKEKFSFINYFQQNKIGINYQFNLDNNFDKIFRNNFSIYGSYKKFYTSLSLDERNQHIGSERSGSISVKKLLNENYFLSFENKKNLINNESEYNKFSINYENDCITYSLSYSKEFYKNEDVIDSKVLKFSILIKPFSENFNQDLTDFIN